MKAKVCALYFALGLASAQLHAECTGFDFTPLVEPPEEVAAETCVYLPYPGDPADERQQLDVYRPQGAANAPVVLLIPGGGWIQGDKESYSELGFTLSGFHGFVTVVANYRLSDPEGGGVVHPAHVHDAAAAFAWVKANIAGYGGDPARVFLFGQSAGAHLVSLLGTDPEYLEDVGYGPDEVRGVISMSGMYDLPALAAKPNPLGLGDEEVNFYRGMFLTAFGSARGSQLIDPSPQTHVHSDQPPFLVAYSTEDVFGMEQGAKRFVAAVRALDPAPAICLHKIQWYTDDVWTEAQNMAIGDPENPGLLADYPGHYAEMVAINTGEPESYPTQLVVEFVNTH